MGLFQYQDESKTDRSGSDQPPTVRVCDNGDENYTNYRMTVPKAIAENLGMKPGDHVKVEQTDNGFKATVIEI